MDMPTLPVDFFKQQNWVFEDFYSLQEIGKGKDTVIYSAVCPKLGNRRVAVKVYDRQKVQPTKYRAIKREIAMMMFFSAKRLPFCVEYYGAFSDAEHIYVIMEFCGGGDLLEKLLKDKKAMNEKKVAVEVAIPLLTILRQLHAMKIIHRDIKLENIFIDDAGRVKLGDFGLTMSMKQESAISPVGTVEYMAPEVVALPPVDLVISGQIKAQDIPPTNEKVDIWALGVTMYELVTGRLPFEGKDKPEIKKNITANNLAGFPSFLTPQCQSIIRAMLTYNPAERPSAEALLSHPYIQMYSAPPKPQHGLPSNVISLQAFTPGASGAPGAGVRTPPGTPQLLPGSPGGSWLNAGSRPGSSRQQHHHHHHHHSQQPQQQQLTYKDALAGVAPPGDPGTPRTPGGSAVGFTVQKGRPATTMASPLARGQGATGPFADGGDFGGAGDVREQQASAARQGSYSSFRSPGASKGSAGRGGGGGGGLDHLGQEDGPARRAQSWSSPRGYQSVSPSGGSGSGTGMVQAMKSTLKKLFTRRSTHTKLDDAQDMQLDSPGGSPAINTSFA